MSTYPESREQSQSNHSRFGFTSVDRVASFRLVAFSDNAMPQRYTNDRWDVKMTIAMNDFSMGDILVHVKTGKEFEVLRILGDQVDLLFTADGKSTSSSYTVEAIEEAINGRVLKKK